MLTDRNLLFQLSRLPTILIQVRLETRDLVVFVVDGFVQRLELLTDPLVAFLLRAELIATTLLRVQLLATLLFQSQPTARTK